MKAIRFTDYNTVILEDSLLCNGRNVVNQKEITLKKFFKTLEQNLGQEDFMIDYNYERGIFYINYYGDNYLVIFNKEDEEALKNHNVIYNQTIQHLIDLATIQKEITGDLGTTLSIPENELYLSILKRNTPSQYFINYFNDLKKAIIKAKPSPYEQEKLFTVLKVGTVIGLYAAGVLSHVAKLSLLLTVSPLSLGVALCASSLIYKTLKNLINNRLNRLRLFNKNSQVKKTKISSLEKIISNDNTQDKEEEKVLETNIQDKEEETIKNIIPNMINNLIDLLKTIAPENRGSLGNEIKELLEDYKKMVTNNFKTDRELFIENKNLQNRMANLEIRINNAKRLNNIREQEAEYLIAKLENMDNEEEKGIKRTK